jgi:hypothetical protein
MIFPDEAGTLIQQGHATIIAQIHQEERMMKNAQPFNEWHVATLLGATFA